MPEPAAGAGSDARHASVRPVRSAIAASRRAAISGRRRASAWSAESPTACHSVGAAATGHGPCHADGALRVQRPRPVVDVPQVQAQRVLSPIVRIGTTRKPKPFTPEEHLSLA